MREEDTVKLVIQIPCYNEEATLPETVRDTILFGLLLTGFFSLIVATSCLIS